MRYGVYAIFDDEATALAISQLAWDAGAIRTSQYRRVQGGPSERVGTRERAEPAPSTSEPRMSDAEPRMTPPTPRKTRAKKEASVVKHTVVPIEPSDTEEPTDFHTTFKPVEEVGSKGVRRKPTVFKPDGKKFDAAGAVLDVVEKYINGQFTIADLEAPLYPYAVENPSGPLAALTACGFFRCVGKKGHSHVYEQLRPASEYVLDRKKHKGLRNVQVVHDFAKGKGMGVSFHIDEVYRLMFEYGYAPTGGHPTTMELKLCEFLSVSDDGKWFKFIREYKGKAPLTRKVTKAIRNGLLTEY